jgi:hypothetical protein
LRKATISASSFNSIVPRSQEGIVVIDNHTLSLPTSIKIDDNFNINNSEIIHSTFKIDSITYENNKIMITITLTQYIEDKTQPRYPLRQNNQTENLELSDFFFKYSTMTKKI